MVHLERLENMLADLLRLASEQLGGDRTRAEVAAKPLPGPGDSHAQRIIQTKPLVGLRTRCLAT